MRNNINKQKEQIESTIEEIVFFKELKDTHSIHAYKTHFYAKLKTNKDWCDAMIGVLQHYSVYLEPIFQHSNEDDIHELERFKDWLQLQQERLNSEDNK